MFLLLKTIRIVKKIFLSEKKNVIIIFEENKDKSYSIYSYKDGKYDRKLIDFRTNQNKPMRMDYTYVYEDYNSNIYINIYDKNMYSTYFYDGINIFIICESSHKYFFHYLDNKNIFCSQKEILYNLKFINNWSNVNSCQPLNSQDYIRKINEKNRDYDVKDLDDNRGYKNLIDKFFLKLELEKEIESEISFEYRAENTYRFTKLSVITPTKQKFNMWENNFDMSKTKYYHEHPYVKIKMMDENKVIFFPNLGNFYYIYDYKNNVIEEKQTMRLIKANFYGNNFIASPHKTFDFYNHKTKKNETYQNIIFYDYKKDKRFSVLCKNNASCCEQNLFLTTSLENINILEIKKYDFYGEKNMIFIKKYLTYNIFFDFEKKCLCVYHNNLNINKKCRWKEDFHFKNRILNMLLIMKKIKFNKIKLIIKIIKYI